MEFEIEKPVKIFIPHFHSKYFDSIIKILIKCPKTFLSKYFNPEFVKHRESAFPDVILQVCYVAMKYYECDVQFIFGVVGKMKLKIGFCSSLELYDVNKKVAEFEHDSAGYHKKYHPYFK